MGLRIDQANALTSHLADKYGAKILKPDSTEAVVLRSALIGLGAVVPVVLPFIGLIKDHFEKVSVTLPSPFGTLIILSKAAVADHETMAETVCHEVAHAEQIQLYGGGQTAVDYLGSGELRAQREADAYAVGWFFRYLIGKQTKNLDITAELSALGGGTYHLDASEVKLCEGILTSHLTTIAAGLAPPIQVAIDLLAWMKDRAPECIVPEEFKAT